MRETSRRLLSLKRRPEELRPWMGALWPWKKTDAGRIFAVSAGVRILVWARAAVEARTRARAAVAMVRIFMRAPKGRSRSYLRFSGRSFLGDCVLRSGVGVARVGLRHWRRNDK